MNKIKKLVKQATIQRGAEMWNKLIPKDFNAVICPLLCNPRKVIKIERKKETGIKIGRRTNKSIKKYWTIEIKDSPALKRSKRKL